MNGRRQELPHNTPEQVREYLADAAVIVDELDLPDELRAVAFEKAVDMLAAKQILMEQVQVGPPLMHVPRGL